MIPKLRAIPMAVLISIAPLVTHAGSLRCQGDIIEPGVTEQRLINVCGSPTSRKGSDWLYEKEGSVPVVVTIGNGVVMFIRDLDESNASYGVSPPGDHPWVHRNVLCPLNVCLRPVAMFSQPFILSPAKVSGMNRNRHCEER